MKRISMLTLALVAAIVAAAMAQDSNTESKAANPTQGKFGRTLLKIGTRYYPDRISRMLHLSSAQLTSWYR
jgi:hypothetical protein